MTMEFEECRRLHPHYCLRDRTCDFSIPHSQIPKPDALRPEYNTIPIQSSLTTFYLHFTPLFPHTRNRTTILLHNQDNEVKKFNVLLHQSKCLKGTISSFGLSYPLNERQNIPLVTEHIVANPRYIQTR